MGIGGDLPNASNWPERMLTRRSIFAGVVGGEIVLLAGKWWLG